MTFEGKILIATSENDRAKLREDLQKLIRSGDEVITNQYKGKLHAEEKIVRRAGTSLYVIAASWSICSLCKSQIDGVHATAVTRCRADINSRRRADGVSEPEPEPEPTEDPPQDEQ